MPKRCLCTNAWSCSQDVNIGLALVSRPTPASLHTCALGFDTSGILSQVQQTRSAAWKGKASNSKGVFCLCIFCSYLQLLQQRDEHALECYQTSLFAYLPTKLSSKLGHWLRLLTPCACTVKSDPQCTALVTQSLISLLGMIMLAVTCTPSYSKLCL